MTNEICSVFYVLRRPYKGTACWKFPRRVSCENRIKFFSLATQVVTHYAKQGGIFCSTTWRADAIYICVIHSLLSGVSIPHPCRAGRVISRLSIGCWGYAKPYKIWRDSPEWWVEKILYGSDYDLHKSLFRLAPRSLSLGLGYSTRSWHKSSDSLR